MRVNFDKLSLREALKKLLNIIDIVQPKKESSLTDRETDLLAEFLILPKKYEYFLFSDRAKKEVRQSLKNQGWKVSIQSMNSKIYSMLDKGVLYRDEDRVIYLNKTIKAAAESLIASYADSKPYYVVFELSNASLIQDRNGKKEDLQDIT